ncbi:CRISPR-associated endonuclease Cas1 [Candidatus Aciduliprofundum boonei]|uniref:CRISPR-associated endonuclease Cas1 n=1 Tax=Aciduliprofundum boonei (strain DSM 19572 / T469) TaxID=439481 RepID=B5IAF4_ACIB4|nr:CRISPR-associated endonuclease Cas1 [Candidatus Aciduliprofundum boonei]ADD08202.1 CRISPR-associated protein Cas1 [Aciduliprofundum boonei T469]EDY36873.1 CRISPR-associated protein Cas1 [Aciduliprofundum boonei T469]
MNPLLVSGYGISINVDKRKLVIREKGKQVHEFYPHQINYDSLIIEGYYGNISFEAIRWLMKHNITVSVLNWNGNLLSVFLPKEPINGKLKIRQYEIYINEKERLKIAEKILEEKIRKSENMLYELSEYYPEIEHIKVKKRIEKEEKLKRDMELKEENKPKLSYLLMYEGRVAQIYWKELSKIFNKLYPEFNFTSRSTKSYSWNMNASDEINALLNYSYALLESMIRKHINAVGLDPSIGFLHELASSKTPLVYDLQELFRWVSDLSVIQLLEDKKLKKSSFIVTENYHIRLKPQTSKLLVEKFKLNMNKKYEVGKKRYTLETIMFNTVRSLGKYILGKSNTLKFEIPYIRIEHIEPELTEKILKMTPEERKARGINKSTLWYQKKKLAQGKSIKVYGKVKSKLK